MKRRGSISLVAAFGIGMLAAALPIILSVTSSEPNSLTELCKQIIGANFMPHGHCYYWEPGLLWLHVSSDAIISLSYFSIPIGLVIFATRRKEASFHKLLILFGAFICLCGLTHLFSVYNVWQASYWMSGFVKAATAAISALTAIVLLRSLPKALAIPLPQEYNRVAQALEDESVSRRDAEKRLEARTNEQSAELWSSDSRWRSLAEFIYSAVWQTDTDGQIRHTLPTWEKFTGQTFEQYQGYGWLNAIMKSDRDALKTVWDQCVETGEAYEFEGHIWSAEKEKYVPFITKGLPIKDAEGTIHEWLGAVYDLSEIKNQEVALASFSRKLQSQNTYLKDLTHMASHDLREPLRKIHAYGDIIEEDFANELPEEALQHFELMRKSAKRMTQLIDDLLSYSHASSYELKIHKVDTTQLIRQIEEDLEVAIKESGATIDYSNLTAVDADPVQLGSTLQNLIENSIKYRSPNRKPVIRITTRIVERDALPATANNLTNPRYYEIEVADNGMGFDEKYISVIQKPFKRLHSREAYPGTGMGLAICTQIIARHNGHLHIRSQIDVGSTFSIFLPVIH